MDLPEVNAHSFVVRIWLEEPTSKGRDALWRGQITHVPSGEQRYVRRLRDLIDFIAPFLETMGVRLGTSNADDA